MSSLTACKDAANSSAVDAQAVEGDLERVDTSVLFSHLISGSTSDDIEWQLGVWDAEFYSDESLSEARLLYHAEIIQSDIEPVPDVIGFAITVTNDVLSHWELMSVTNGPDGSEITFVSPRRVLDPRSEFVGENIDLEIRVANSVNYLNSEKLLQWSNSRVPDMALIGARIGTTSADDSTTVMFVEFPPDQVDQYSEWLAHHSGDVLLFSVHGVPRSYARVVDPFRHNRFNLPLNVKYD